MKHWEQTLATYVYNHCNICNISIYFCNTHIKHLQHTLKHLKHLKHRLQHALFTNPGRRLGGQTTAQPNPTVRVVAEKEAAAAIHVSLGVARQGEARPA
jgi:hypothetical protein